MEHEQITSNENSEKTAFFKDNFDFVDKCVLSDVMQEMEQLPVNIDELNLDELDGIE